MPKKVFSLLLCSVLLFLFYSYSAKSQPLSPVKELLYIESIVFSGNKKTHNNIISREIPIQKGDTIVSGQLADILNISKNNLLNTKLFNYVTIDTLIVNNRVTITIILEERWYFWPIPSLNFADRNFSTWMNSKDWRKIIYGLDLEKNNFRGRNEVMNFSFSIGYNEQFSLSYNDLYLDKKRHHSIGIYNTYLRRKQTSVAVIENRLQELRVDETYVFEHFEFSLKYTYRHKNHNWHTLFLSLNYSQIADTIADINPNYFGTGKTNIRFVSLIYSATQDLRDSKSYPLSGSYTNFIIRQSGLGVLDHPNILLIKSRFAKYWDFGNRVHAATAVNLQKSFSDQKPFFLDKAIGYKYDQIRGYEYYVVNGSDFFITKANLKFTIIPTKVKLLNFFPMNWFNGKFKKIHYALYANIFFDTGYAKKYGSIYENRNSFENKLLYSGGIGLDFVTYYDRVLRFEYSIIHNGESGFFVHFLAPI